MLPFLSLILAAAVHTDTLVVEEAKIEGPHPIPAVHMTDSVNLEGKRYDITDILKQNTSLALRPFKTDAGVIRNGDAVGKPSSSDSIATLSVLQVTVDAVRWTKCRLISEQMKQHKYFLDGKETDGEMRLLPGRHEIKIIDFVDATAAPDTFDLRITGNDLSHLNVNPTTPRNFDLDLNVHGPRYGGISISPSGRYAATQYLNVLEGGENITPHLLTSRPAVLFMQENTATLNGVSNVMPSTILGKELTGWNSLHLTWQRCRKPYWLQHFRMPISD